MAGIIELELAEANNVYLASWSELRPHLFVILRLQPHAMRTPSLVVLLIAIVLGCTTHISAADIQKAHYETPRRLSSLPCIDKSDFWMRNRKTGLRSQHP